MRFTCPAAAVAFAAIAPSIVMGAAAISAPDLTVGRHLQAMASVRLAKPATDAVPVTITSADPAKVLFSAAPDMKGSASITVTFRRLFLESPTFWVQALSDSGAVTYTAVAEGIGSARATITLAPSAIVIAGPFKLPSFPTTPRAYPSKLVLVSAVLDPSLKIIEEQQIAGGLNVEVNIRNSAPEAGVVEPAKLVLPGGTSVAATHFRPRTIGKTTLTPDPPPGFHAAAEMAGVLAVVDKPGLAVTDEVTIGKDLQTPGVLCLGEAAPPGGLEVTLTSSDKNLLLSARPDELGSVSLKLRVPPGELTAKYFLQAMSGSGAVTYKAAASEYRSRTAKVSLAPSGVIVAYERYGPPDEAAVRRKGAADDERRFYVSISEMKNRPAHVVVWAVHLDPETHLAADITVQELRPGVFPKIVLKSSNPSVGTVESPLEIAVGSSHVASRFMAVAPGETVISVSTPEGFSTPRNATSVPVTVAN